jgi:hypothetical protein
MNIHAFLKHLRDCLLGALLASLSIHFAVAAVAPLSDAELEKSTYIATGSVKSLVFSPPNNKECGHTVNVLLELIRDDAPNQKIDKIAGETYYLESDCIGATMLGHQGIHGLLKLKVGARVKIYGSIDVPREQVSEFEWLKKLQRQPEKRPEPVPAPEPKISIRRPNGLEILTGK